MTRDVNTPAKTADQVQPKKLTEVIREAMTTSIFKNTEANESFKILFQHRERWCQVWFLEGVDKDRRLS